MKNTSRTLMVLPRPFLHVIRERGDVSDYRDGEIMQVRLVETSQEVLIYLDGVLVDMHRWQELTEIPFENLIHRCVYPAKAKEEVVTGH